MKKILLLVIAVSLYSPSAHAVLSYNATNSSLAKSAPTSVAADGTSTVTVTATVRNSGNALITSICSVSLSSSRGATDTVSGGGVVNASGQVVFTVKTSTPGTPTFTATVTTGANPCTGTSGPIVQTVPVTFFGSPSPTNSLNNALPTTLAANGTASANVLVALQDSNNNPVLAAKSVTLSSSRGAVDTITPTPGTTSASTGVATFSITSTTAGTATITTTDTTDGVTLTQTNLITFTAGTATQLSFSVQPSNATAGSSISPSVVVQALDAYNNLDTTYTGNVTLAVGTNPGSGTLSGTLTVAAVSGVATFPGLSINKSGTGYTLSASASGKTGATSSTFNITAGTAAQLSFSVQPSSTGKIGIVFPQQPEVEITDSNGNIISTTATVTLGVSTNSCSTTTSAGTLSGSSAVSSLGVASFSGLSYTKVGTFYLQASSGALTSACSSAFTLSPATPTALITCQFLSSSGFTVNTATERLANSSACLSNELQFYSRSNGAPNSVCVAVDCGVNAKVCRSVSQSARSVDYYCAHQ